MSNAPIDLGDALGLVARVRAGMTTTAAVAAAVRARAQEMQHLNAFVDPTLPGLEERAAAAPEGVLFGLPVAVKDIVDVVGLPTSGGTRALLGRRPVLDAPLAAALRAAGAVVVGKNTLHELSFGVTSNNACTGPARNPADPSRIPGGSSGGTAAAVASGIAPVGLAADTGGSVRIPAALCGIVGYRPTHGRYCGDGLLPISHTRDTAGLMAHRVADIRLVDAVIASGVTPAEPRRAGSLSELAGLRLGIPSDYWSDLDPEVLRLCLAARRRLADAGVTMTDVDLSGPTALADEIGLPLCIYEFPRDLAIYLARGGAGITVEQVCAAVESADVRDIVQTCLAAPVDDAAYDILLDRLGELRYGYAQLLDEHRLDGLLFPTTPLPAAPIGHDETTPLNGRDVPTFPTFIRHANLAGVAGHPGISVPVGRTVAGLPVGIEIDARVGEDEPLLALAHAAEPVLRV